jgi:putative copper resistance protein D
MITPVLLLLGRPVTLALRALPTWSRARRILLVVLHSRLARTLTAPWVTLPLFLASLYGLYFTPVFDVLMNNWLGHDLMLTHFVVVGLLLFWPILGLDPSPHQHPHAVRLLEVLLPMPFHAFFGISLMSTSTLIVHTYAHPPVSWHLSPLTDQHTGGALAWAFGEVPTLAVSLLVAMTWAQASSREARRHDRSEARTHDAQLTAYNARLARLNRHTDSTP